MNKFQKFVDDLFKDRAGADELSLFLSVLGLVCIVGAGAFSYPYVEVVLTFLGVCFLALSVFRIFSKDKSKRYKENYKFKTLFSADPKKKAAKEAEKAKKKALKEKLKTHEMFYCPKCKASCFVPKGKGKVRITCPKCGEKFIGKT